MSQKEIIQQAIQLIQSIGFDLESEGEKDSGLNEDFDQLLDEVGKKARSCGYSDEDIGMITQDY